MISEWQRMLLSTARVAHLATVDATGQPHVVPIVFVFDGQRLFTPLDGKPKRVAEDRLQRVRNIAADDRVAVVVDHYDEDWQQLAWVQVRGLATLLTSGTDYQAAIALLRQKYPQYQSMPLDGHMLICMTPEHIHGWRALPDA